MVRRRFFPMQAVQTAPARSVEFEMRLQPSAALAGPSGAPAEEPGGGCDIDGAGWLSQAFYEPAAWTWELLMDGRWRVSNARTDSYWVGAPPDDGAAGLGLGPTPSATFRCVELEVSSLSPARLHIGALYGSSISGAVWEASWDAVSSEDAAQSVLGSRFEANGSALVVEQSPTGGSVAAVETLTATAFCHGSVAATLILRCRHEESVASGCDLDGVGWFSHVFDEYGEWVWSELPDGRWSVVNGYMDSFWEGDPDPAEPAGMLPPTPRAGFRCVELEVRPFSTALLHVGVLQGASMSDAVWEAAWDLPSAGDPSVSAVGNRFFTSGNTIIVRKLDTGGSLDAEETLTARAYCHGALAGTLVLRCVHWAY